MNEPPSVTQPARLDTTESADLDQSSSGEAEVVEHPVTSEGCAGSLAPEGGLPAENGDAHGLSEFNSSAASDATRQSAPVSEQSTEMAKRTGRIPCPADAYMDDSASLARRVDEINLNIRKSLEETRAELPERRAREHLADEQALNSLRPQSNIHPDHASCADESLLDENGQKVKLPEEQAAKTSSASALSARDARIHELVGPTNFVVLTNANIMRDRSIRKRLRSEGGLLKARDASKACFDRIRRAMGYPMSREIENKRSKQR